MLFNSALPYFFLVTFVWLGFIAWLLVESGHNEKILGKKMDFLNEAQRHTALAVLELLEAFRLERTAQVKQGSPFDSEQPFGAEGPIVRSIEVEPNSELDQLMRQVMSVVERRSGDVFCIGCKGANFPNANTCGICAQARGVKGPVVN